MNDKKPPDGEFGLAMPFLTDGDAYTDRERLMFTTGYEFCQLHVLLEENPGPEISRPVHRENEDRIRVLCGRLGRRYQLEPIDETWCQLDVELRE